jgi:hypothetical protein
MPIEEHLIVSGIATEVVRGSSPAPHAIERSHCKTQVRR